MNEFKQILDEMDSEKAAVYGAAMGVVVGTMLIPFTDNPGLAIGMATSFGAAIGLILASVIEDLRDDS